MREQLPQVTPHLRVGGREWSVPTALAALRHRNYRLWWFGQLVSLTGTWMQSTAQQWLVFRLTDSPLALGAVMFASALPVTLFALVAGVVVDRVDRRRLVLGLQAVLLLQAVTLAVLTATGTVRAWHVFALAAVLGTVNAFDMPARHVLSAQLVGRADLMNAIALNSSIFNGARLAGPALAGLLVAWKGEAVVFSLNAASFVAVIAALLAMRLPASSAAEREAQGPAHVREGLAHLARSPRTLALVVMAGVASIFGFSFTTLVPVVASRRLGLDADGFGLLNSAVGFGALVAAVSLASLGDVRRKGRLLHFARSAFALALVAFALAPTLPIAMLALAIAGWGMITHLATTNTLIQSQTPDRLRGRVMAAYTMAVVGMAPFGSLLLGGMAESVGAGPALLVAGAACLASVVASVALFPAARTLDAQGQA